MFALKLVVLAFVAVSLAAEDAPKPDVEVLTENAFVREDGYNFAYKLSDGISRQEEGELITVGDHKGIGVKGSYSYVAPDGQEYTVTYTADDKGFNPVVHAAPAAGQ
ncbi:endocuticle structural glycoprotein SgAbd-5-like [Choristoneura fumiferana]|uniref:endocuticle structural glycoprotein SgAbd-5-like n=1 Tax=Choristoneura fumiferana TaxID=7141 RepID=UPI003D15C2A5